MEATNSTSRGFTLIEMLVAITILATLSTLIFVSFASFSASESLESSASAVVSSLREARTMAISSKEASLFGIRLEESRIVLFGGATYSASDSGNVPYNLNSLTVIRNISLNGGGSEVVFSRLTGGTNNYGSFEGYLKSSTTTYKRIEINKTGLAEISSQ